MAPVRLSVALLLSIACSGCPKDGARRLDVNAAPPDQAGMIVVYRPSNLLLLAASSEVVVDGRLMGTVKQGGAWTILVQPGEHVVGISSSTTHQTTPSTVHVDSGEAVYLRVSPGSLRFNLGAVGASEGRAVVAQLTLNGKSDFRDRDPSTPLLAAAPAPPTSSPAPPADPVELPRMLVMPMHGDALDAVTQDTMTQLLVTYLSASGRFMVLSSRDLERLVDLSAERQKLDCSTDACLAEIGSAYGARFVTYSQASKLGELLLINTTLFDVERAAPVGREVAQAQTLSALPAALESAAARLVAHRR